MKLAGYEIDHIVPLNFVAKHINDTELAFKFAMDLKNLQALPSYKNRGKQDSLNYPGVKDTLVFLCEKYLNKGAVKWL